MLLLYRQWDRWRTGWLCLYIPLCFYFICSSRDGWMWYWNHLHSTMLLLYHIVQSIGNSVRLHLHSTMLLLYRRGFWSERYWSSAFTFHYASTLSHFPGQCRRGIADLHSTMLLLYPIWLMIARTSRCTIYIPLCFYFIMYMVERPLMRSGTFTFHYASTLSSYMPNCPVSTI